MTTDKREELSMEQDWRAGDRAVYVDGSVSDEDYAPPELELGRVYTVFGTGIDQFGQVGLFLDETDSEGLGGGYLAWRFRKLVTEPALHENAAKADTPKVSP